MPFVPPSGATQAYSQANSGYQATVAIGDANSPTGWTVIAELKTFTIKEYDVATLDATQLLSPNATGEKVPGILMPGDIQMTGNYTGVTAQELLSTMARSQTVYPVRIVGPVQNGTKTRTLMGHGFTKSRDLGPFEPNKIIDFASVIELTGSWYVDTTV